MPRPVNLGSAAGAKAVPGAGLSAIRAFVFAAERIHADDIGGAAVPAAALFNSPDRGGQHPEQHLASYVGLMQADAYAGFNRLYQATCKPGPIVEAARGAGTAQVLRAGSPAESADRD